MLKVKVMVLSLNFLCLYFKHIWFLKKIFLPISGFVFLRLICPAILSPRMFNIISGNYLLINFEMEKASLNGKYYTLNQNLKI